MTIAVFCCSRHLGRVCDDEYTDDANVVVKRIVPESVELDEKRVKAYCAERLARYKELTGGVRFVEAIPKNASGKILKRVLREEAKAKSDAGKEKARL